jgi:hypothetical protein
MVFHNANYAIALGVKSKNKILYVYFPFILDFAVSIPTFDYVIQFSSQVSHSTYTYIISHIFCFVNKFFKKFTQIFIFMISLKFS